MNDQEYFEQYQKSFETVYSSRTNDHVFLKDAEFRFRSVSESILAFLGISSKDKIINYTAEEVGLKHDLANSEIAQQFSTQDSKIQQSDETGVYLEVLSLAGQHKIFVVTKTPVINPASGNFVGIRGQLTNLIWPHAVKTLLKMHGVKGLLLGSKNTQDAWKEYSLTSMQHMVLFLCINNYSYSEIAVLLNEFGYEITPLRVNDYLEQLKFIFHVRNKIQLIEKSVGLNFHLFLPEGLFNKFCSAEISHETAAIMSYNRQNNNG